MIYLKKILLYGIIPVFLLAGWIILAILQDSGTNLLSLKSQFGDEVFLKSNHDGLFKGQKVVIRFKADQDNLGIFSVRFHTFERINDDVVVFRIKEADSKNWYYENKYLTDQFQWDELFTFGFPIISDSKDKEYIIEIESLNGSYNKAVAISKKHPVAEAQFKFNKNSLLQDQNSLAEFLYKKVINSIGSGTFIFKSLVFLLPLIYYIFWLFRSKFKVEHKYWLLTTFTFILYLYILLVPTINRDVHLYFLIFWFISIFFLKLESSVSFLFALIYLITTAILVFLDYENSAEKSAIFVYFFLLSATFQLMYEHFKEPKGMLGYKDILTALKINFTKFYKWDIHIRLYEAYLNLVKIIFKTIKKYFVFKNGSKKEIVYWCVRIFLALLIIVFILNKISVFFYNMEKYVPITSFLSIREDNSGLFIDKAEPGYVKIGDKVVILGSGFNTKIETFVRIKTSGGEVRSEFNSSNRLEFSVPMEWKPGFLYIWVEDGSRRSNKVKIKVIDRLGNYSADDFWYYYQIKFLTDEAKSINEFRNYKYGTRYVGEILKFLL